MARITLDLDALLSEGRITPQEAERLRSLALAPRGLAVLVQVLYILGALGLAVGVVLLKPDPAIGILLALVALGIAYVCRGRESLQVLASGFSIAGTVGLCGASAMQLSGLVPPMVINALMTAITLAGAVLFESLFLIALVPFGLAAVLGSGTAYWHAAYGVFIREPTINAVLFAALWAALEFLSRRLKGIRSQQAVISARVSWIIANMALWVGSLWGDYVGEWFASGGKPWSWEGRQAWREHALFLPDWFFVFAWAAVCVAAIITFRSNRFAVNASVIFLAVNGYTQFFERFADNALALIAGGVTLFALAFGLFRYDRWAETRRRSA